MGMALGLAEEMGLAQWETIGTGSYPVLDQCEHLLYFLFHPYTDPSPGLDQCD